MYGVRMLRRNGTERTSLSLVVNCKRPFTMPTLEAAERAATKMQRTADAYSFDVRYLPCPLPSTRES